MHPPLTTTLSCRRHALARPVRPHRGVLQQARLLCGQVQADVRGGGQRRRPGAARGAAREGQDVLRWEREDGGGSHELLQVPTRAKNIELVLCVRYMVIWLKTMPERICTSLGAFADTD